MFSVLLKGNCLQNPAFWKKFQINFNLFCSWLPILLIIFPGLSIYLTPENLAAFSTALTSTNAYLTVATSDKIGL